MITIDEGNEKAQFHRKILDTRWPGIQLYYPPIKFVPKHSDYETIEAATERLERFAVHSKAHTLLFDLEDGCSRKALSRELLRKEIYRFENKNIQIAIRINPFLTEEYSKDLKLLKEIGNYVHVITLAKAGEQYGTAEIRDLSSDLVEINSKMTVQPIIEHPRSLKLAPEMMNFSTVKHLVFGIHDFSKAMAIHITPENWLEELRPYLYDLLFEARQAGRGVIGGVDPLINQEGLPDNAVEPSDVRRWLDLNGDKASHIVFSHASTETALGLTGKQVIHPNHINLCRVAFIPSPSTIRRNIKILQIALEADALTGGAVRFEGEMLDPPMFGKALQAILRAKALGELSEKEEDFILFVLKKLPDRVILENWPYAGFN
ncbi:HpcH/HpaI aldolase/citrate lyase family protein [Leptospira ilyithenensis]|uniref:Aldolase n=1 Tax=Leptospira ilyithenensis TaxID=2484901 RepID=A0A4R9LQL2_9LEPT|nr:aldolase/citrate lyase family protein [Leptospira ilyithenensis]TGN11865.1 aldolase [Leptospira ilyithenensis]